MVGFLFFVFLPLPPQMLELQAGVNMINLSYKVHYTFQGDSTPVTYCLPKALPTNIITLAIRFQRVNFGSKSRTCNNQ